MLVDSILNKVVSFQIVLTLAISSSMTEGATIGGRADPAMPFLYHQTAAFEQVHGLGPVARFRARWRSRDIEIQHTARVVMFSIVSELSLSQRPRFARPSVLHMAQEKWVKPVFHGYLPTPHLDVAAAGGWNDIGTLDEMLSTRRRTHTGSNVSFQKNLGEARAG